MALEHQSQESGKGFGPPLYNFMLPHMNIIQMGPIAKFCVRHYCTELLLNSIGLLCCFIAGLVTSSLTMILLIR